MRVHTFLLAAVCAIASLSILALGEYCIPGETPVACAIYHQTIAYPGTIHSHGAKISQITCTNFTLGPLTSFVNSSLGLFVEAKLGMSCSAKGSFAGAFSCTVSGDIHDTTIALGIDLVRGSVSNGIELPQEALLSYCSAYLNASNIVIKKSSKLSICPANTIKGILLSEQDQIEEGLNAFLCGENSTLQKLVSEDFTALLSTLNENLGPLLVPSIPLEPMPVPDDDNPVNFTKSVFIKDLSFLLNNLLGVGGINKLVNLFTHDTGSIRIGGGNLFGISHTMELLGENFTFNLDLEEVEIGGLNTFDSFDVLDATSAYIFATGLELRKLSFENVFSTGISISGVRELVNVYDSQSKMRALSLENMFNMTTQVLMDKAQLKQLWNHPKALFNPVCDLAIFNNASFLDIYSDSSFESLEVVPLIGDRGGLAEVIDNVIVFLLSGYGEALPEMIDHFLGGVIRNLVNEEIWQLSDSVAESTAPCNATFDMDNGNDDWRHQVKIFSMFSALVLSIIIGAVLTYLPLTSSQYDKKHPMDMEDDLTYPDEKQALLSDSTVVRVNAACSYDEPCLGANPLIPWFVRVGIPTLLLLLIAVYLSSNTSTGASVYMFLSTVGDNAIHQLPSLFRFSLWNSVKDMWVAKVYPLSILIMAFSGIWPYVKALLMLTAWLLPASVMSQKYREWVLMMLDALGKWSLIDAYVLTLMMVAFRFNLGFGAIVLDLIVVPEWGFYSFLAATMASLALTHIILAVHRRTMDPPVLRSFLSQKAEALCAHSFPLGGRKVRWTPFGMGLVAGLLVLTIILVVWGALVNSFVFEFGGLVSLLMKGIGEDTSVEYSLITVGSAITASAQNPDGAGVIMIEVVFFIFALAVPLLHLISLLVIWLVPLKPVAQRRAFVMAEVLNAWSALEVFVVSIIAALVEISQFAEFIIGGNCDPINNIMQNVPFFIDRLPADDLVCFSVNASLSSGCWILFTACITYILCRNIVMHICHATIEQRFDIARESAKRISRRSIKDNGPINYDVDEDADRVRAVVEVDMSEGTETCLYSTFVSLNLVRPVVMFENI